MKLTFLGDVMLDNEMAKNLDAYRINGKYDFQSVFNPIKALLSKSDYVVANLETPISDRNCDIINKQWEFCAPVEFAQALKACGVTCVSAANNHCLDRGVEGLRRTITCLKKIGLTYCGIYNSTKNKKIPLIVNVKGVELGVLSYTYGTNAVSNHQYLSIKDRKIVDLLQEQEGAIDKLDILGKFARKHPYNVISKCRYKFNSYFLNKNEGKMWYEKTTFNRYRKKLLKRDIKKLKKRNVNYIILCMHIGGQYNEKPSEYTNEMCRWAEKNGCNFIIANHEHVVHGCKNDVINGKLTAYALGNCLGSAGVLHEPFDRFSEYSIAVHIYENKSAITKITFSVLRSFQNPDGKFEVWPVYELLNSNLKMNLEKIKIDCLEVAKLFSGKSFDNVQEEFLL